MSWQTSVERLARFGYICKGFVYVVVGLLTAGTIAGHARASDRQDAFRYILDKPFGRFVLLIIAIGLLGYAFWRVSSGIADWERHGSDAKGVAIRIGSVIRGLFYGWIAVELTRQVLRYGGGGKGSDRQARHWTARAMDAPFGRVAVGVAGACIMGYCLVQLVSAIRGKFSTRIRTRSIPPSLLAISRFGLGARAIIFGIIGMSLVKAALFYNPSRARGTAGAMRTLASQPYGGVLLALSGLGLVAYGIYAFVNAKYRQIAAS